jgi:hypothetical protein
VNRKQDWLEENVCEGPLNVLTKIFKNYVADQSGKNSNAEIGDGENIFNGKNKALSLGIRASKLPHQKV